MERLLLTSISFDKCLSFLIVVLLFGFKESLNLNCDIFQPLFHDDINLPNKSEIFVVYFSSLKRFSKSLTYYDKNVVSSLSICIMLMPTNSVVGDTMLQRDMAVF